MTHHTAEESENRYVAAMGEALGSQYAQLWQEVVYLHRKWMEYIVLFGNKPSRIPLLNKAAPTFFRMIQDTFWDDTLLHIARLTDPPESGRGKTNLTIQNLPGLTGNAGLTEKLKPLIEKALNQSEFCREWRNKLIAHRDLAVALNGSADLVQGGSRDQVNEILNTFVEIMNHVSLHYLESSTHYRFDGHSGGALALLYVLDDGIKLEIDRLKRVLDGTALEGDHSPRNL